MRNGHQVTASFQKLCNQLTINYFRYCLVFIIFTSLGKSCQISLEGILQVIFEVWDWLILVHFVCFHGSQSLHFCSQALHVLCFMFSMEFVYQNTPAPILLPMSQFACKLLLTNGFAVHYGWVGQLNLPRDIPVFKSFWILCRSGFCFVCKTSWHLLRKSEARTAERSNPSSRSPWNTAYNLTLQNRKRKGNKMKICDPVTENTSKDYKHHMWHLMM